jgi:hypothetical protein
MAVVKFSTIIKTRPKPHRGYLSKRTIRYVWLTARAALANRNRLFVPMVEDLRAEGFNICVAFWGSCSHGDETEGIVLLLPEPVPAVAGGKIAIA